jgi:hypothetical protein
MMVVVAHMLSQLLNATFAMNFLSSALTTGFSQEETCVHNRNTIVTETVGYRLFGLGLFSVVTLISLWLALYLSIHYHDLFLYIFFGILSILDVTG